MTPDISIVVCTYNRAAMLREALASLYDLATDGLFNYEIVVIDNASTDETPQAIASAALSSQVPLRGVREPIKGIVAARNRGIRESQGHWVAFFDDDQLADPRWLAELWRGASQQQCRVVGGAVHLTFPDGTPPRIDPIVRMLLGEAILSDQPLAYGGRATPGCGNLMIERSVFDDVGIFQTTVHGRGEDTDLFVRIERAGIASWYIPTAVIQHVTPRERLEPGYLIRLARHMGEGIALRQAAGMGRRRFALVWLAKAARLSLVQYPLGGLAWLRGEGAALLGRRCLAALNRQFLATGWQRLS
jgi:glycosyltransferase involved in cell wall biosynthesis